MAIIIPSKHIYAVDNQKVIDNQVDKIEVQTYAPQIISATENVYNDRVFVPSWFEGNTQSEHASYSIGGSSTYKLALVISVVPYYTTRTFLIPKSIANSRIVELFVGEDKEGNANIKYSLFGDIKKGVAHGEYIYNSLLTVSWDIDAPTDIITTENNYVISNIISYSAKALNEEHDLTLNLKDDTSTIKTAKIKEETDNAFTIELTVLSGIKINKLAGSHHFRDGETNNYPYGLDMVGEYDEYFPKRIDVSFYGNSITLNLEEDILTINASGEHITSFSGNELMQTTNTPNVDESYLEVISQYKNGRECATIRCGIENYYGVDKIDIKIVGYQSLSPYNYEYYFETDYDIKEGEYIYIDDEAFEVYKNLRGRYTFTGELVLEKNKQYTVGVDARKQVSKTRENNLPMTIPIGGIVIPYKFGANGKDKPMSINKDGKPKEFIVIGKKLTYDGGIWQELTLQENAYISFESWGAKITLLSIFGGEEGFVDLVFKMDRGNLDEGDIIEYKSERAEITNGFVRAKKDGAFEKAIGQTIIVTKIHK